MLRWCDYVKSVVGLLAFGIFTFWASLDFRGLIYALSSEWHDRKSTTHCQILLQGATNTRSTIARRSWSCCVDMTRINDSRTLPRQHNVRTSRFHSPHWPFLVYTLLSKTLLIKKPEEGLQAFDAEANLAFFNMIKQLLKRDYAYVAYTAEHTFGGMKV